MTRRGGRWKFAVDRGGTFTDVVGVDPRGRYHTEKLLSSGGYGDPCIEGIRRVLGLPPGEPLPGGLIESIRFGTTTATNALLERKGGRTLLVITRGFRDLLEIGSQARPDIFSLCVRKPGPLYDEVIEVDGRTGPDGSVEAEPDLDALKSVLERLARPIDAAAVVLMHSWKNPDQEIAVEGVLKGAGITDVHLSHQAVNLIKIVTRGSSAVVDAYLSPVMERYFEGIRRDTGNIPIEFIESSGGLAAAGEFKGKSAIFSGPAGGVLAVGHVAGMAGAAGAVGFDMGGTSTDVSRFESGGGFEKVYEETVAGVELQGESLSIETVASGGGSILWFDGERLRVGPESAGADPGPACYGLEGPLAVTDANLLTGRIIPEFFPATFGPAASSPLDTASVSEKFSNLTEDINSATGSSLGPREAALGFLDIANEKMALAIKSISVSRGYDVRDYALVCFGGAGGQHACAIARLLSMKRIVFHPLAGVMSAYGIGLARPTRKSTKTVLTAYNGETHGGLAAEFARMESDTVPPVWVAGGGRGYESRREVDLRPVGADTFLTVEFSDFEATSELFRRTYRRIYGFFPEGAEVEAVNLRVEVERTGEFFPPYPAQGGGEKDPVPVAEKEVFYGEGLVKAAVYRREDLGGGSTVEGPAVITERFSTIVIDPGFTATVTGDGLITAELTPTPSRSDDAAGPSVGAPAPSVPSVKDGPDPVLLEVFNNLFMGVATEMGHTLRNTGHSVNIKERLDFSCALFDREGGLVANAQHIPVHLGAMADTVRAVLEDNRTSMRPGDVFVSNNPYRGGSHLPDVTVVEPVFSEAGEIIFFVAARGHHADIGGTTPGSLPPEATHIDEEGVLLDGLLLLRDGVFREEDITKALTGARYPARNIPERISDLKAQMAACERGREELERIIGRYGWPVVRRYMRFVQENAEGAVKRALARFAEGAEDGVFEASFADSLDDGTPVVASVTITAGESPPETVRAKVDFTGTGAEHAGDNLNAPLPVVRSAVIYVLRSITGADIPLNSGCLNPVEIIVPEGTLLNPVYPAPVGSGNVETSQRVVDVLLGALGVAAASQGTMNNLLFEVEGEVPYYETIAGGAGAMEGCAGASGVQVHMTNTRITDPEVLEVRHPGVRLKRFTIRRGSGGAGEYPGGDGVERELLFKKPAEVSIISERRRTSPWGMAGAKPGRPGRNVLKGAGGAAEELAHRTFVRVNPGESILIETPGGGGYGKVR